MRWLPALLCAAAALAAGHAAPSPADAPGVDVSEDDVFTLVHRVHTPGGAAPAWAPRAHLKLLADDPEKAQALYRRVAGESEWQSLLASASASASAPASTPGTPAPPNSLYQIALVPGAWESHVDVDSFPSAPVSSTKLCTLTSAAPHEVTVVATPLSEQAPLAPLAIEYAAQVERADLDDHACVKTPAAYPIASPDALRVRVRHPFQSQLPALRLKPVDANEDASKPVVDDTPPPEKTFFQKYWIYIIPAIFILMTNKPPEDSGGAGEGGAGDE